MTDTILGKVLHLPWGRIGCLGITVLPGACLLYMVMVIRMVLEGIAKRAKSSDIRRYPMKTTIL